MLIAEIHVPRAAPDTVSLEDREAEARAAATRDKAGQAALARELQRLGWSKRDTSVDGEKAIWWSPPTDHGVRQPGPGLAIRGGSAPP